MILYYRGKEHDPYLSHVKVRWTASKRDVNSKERVAAHGGIKDATPDSEQPECEVSLCDQVGLLQLAKCAALYRSRTSTSSMVKFSSFPAIS